MNYYSIWHPWIKITMPRPRGPRGIGVPRHGNRVPFSVILMTMMTITILILQIVVVVVAESGRKTIDEE